MTVFFDCRYIRVEQFDGISRYSVELFSELSKLRDIVAIISDERVLALLPANSRFVFEKPPTGLSELGFATRMNSRQASIIFSPMQTTGFIARKFKLISTVHDLIYFTHRRAPRFLPVLARVAWRLYHLSPLLQRLLLKNSDALVTVSQTSRESILSARMWPKSDLKPLRIISPGIDADTFKNIRTRQVDNVLARPDQKILVYAGSFMPYKGVDTIVSALHGLNGYKLHLVSKCDSKTRARLEELAGAANRIVWHEGLTDTEYVALLSSASAFVTASRIEGFGIPLIEAQSMGVPVVCSDIPVFHEVTGGAAEFFAPTDCNAFAAAVMRLTSKRVKELSSQGQSNAARYTWSHSAKKLDELISEMQS